ncbi:MAG: acyl-CoA reductase [Planctomycetaceae bacterium]
MNNLDDLPVEVRVGRCLSSINTRPLSPYAEPVIDFLGDLSKHLLVSSVSRDFPDLAYFGYWCRSANLSRMARETDSRFKRLGRGLAFHIAPANVPVNFAFSLAFGMLSGNANIVRMPSKVFPQSEALCDVITAVLTEEKHQLVASMNRIVRYPRNDVVTAAFSGACQARVIWGGDETIAKVRAMPSASRCVDLAFSDRYSLCVLGVRAVTDCSDRELGDLASAFYKDAYLMDQNACSSPHLVLWLGEEAESPKAAARFWHALATHVRANYNLQPVQAMDKFVDLCRTAIELPQARHFSRSGNFIYRVALQDVPTEIECWRGRNGFFYEYPCPDLSLLTRIVGERYQTITCFGVAASEIGSLICASGLKGVDRIVPVGRALDIGVYWDGFDVIGSLSRIVKTDF